MSIHIYWSNGFLTLVSDFITAEQKILQDENDLAKIKKATEAGIELLNMIQYDNPLCKDDPSVYQDVYDYWAALRKSVATYLFKRSGVQHDNQVSELHMWEPQLALSSCSLSW